MEVSMKKLKLITIVLLALFITTILYSCLCVIPKMRIYPENGIWYCKERQIYLNFGFDEVSKAIIDEKEVDCAAYYYKDSPYITIERLYDFTWENKIIFSGYFVSLNDNELVLCDRDTGVDYAFIRQKTWKTD